MDRIGYFFFLKIRRPPRSTRTDTLFPYTTLFRSANGPIPCGGQAVDHTAPVGFRTALKELENKPSTCDRRSARLVKPVGLEVKRKVESDLVVRKWRIKGTRHDYFRLLLSHTTSLGKTSRCHRQLLLTRASRGQQHRQQQQQQQQQTTTNLIQPN